MPLTDDVHITRKMQGYIDKNNRYLAERARYIEEPGRPAPPLVARASHLGRFLLVGGDRFW